MGSEEFEYMVKNNTLHLAVDVAKEQCANSADMLEINVDTESPVKDAMSLGNLVRSFSRDPVIAKVPFVVASSEFKVMVEGLKASQAKCIAHSISLAAGADAFLEKARECLRFGAAVVVLAEEEEGEAMTADDKVRACCRGYKLLRSRLDFPAEDIILDCNVRTAGAPEYPSSSLEFLK